MYFDLSARIGHTVLKIAATLAVISVLAGCVALPDLQGRDFAEYYQKPDQQVAGNIDARLKGSLGKPIDVSEDEFGEVVLRSPTPVIIMVYATWCEYCGGMDPVFSELAKEYEKRIRFVKINYDKNERLSQRLTALAYPIWFLVKDGKVVDRWGGAKDAKKRIKEHIHDKLQ